jgi:hypothetical protein
MPLSGPVNRSAKSIYYRKKSVTFLQAVNEASTTSLGETIFLLNVVRKLFNLCYALDMILMCRFPDQDTGEI